MLPERDKRRPLLYVCAPVRTAINVERGEVLGIRRRAFALGWAPVWSPLLTDGLELNKETNRAEILDFCLALMEACKSLVIVGSRITEGMRVEFLQWLPRPVILARDLREPAASGHSQMNFLSFTDEEMLTKSVFELLEIAQHRLKEKKVEFLDLYLSSRLKAVGSSEPQAAGGRQATIFSPPAATSHGAERGEARS